MTRRPSVEIEVLPDTSIIPVDASCGHDCLVGSEGVEVIDTSASALQSITIVIASDIAIKHKYGILIYSLRIGVY
jgi:hypothetical protein